MFYYHKNIIIIIGPYEIRFISKLSFFFSFKLFYTPFMVR